MLAEILEVDFRGVRARLRMTDAEGWWVVHQRDGLDHHWCIAGVLLDGDDLRHVGVLPHLQSRPTHGLNARCQQLLDAALESHLAERRRAA